MPINLNLRSKLRIYSFTHQQIAVAPIRLQHSNSALPLSNREHGDMNFSPLKFPIRLASHAISTYQALINCRN